MSFPTMEKQQMRTLRWVLVAAVAVLVSCGGGSSLTQESPIIDCEANSSNVDIWTPDLWTPDLWVVAGYCYKVGDTGPGGGIIVYVDESGFNSFSGGKLFEPSIFALCPTKTCHYLEMAPTDVGGKLSWNDAVNAAENYSTATAADWVLPSIDALNEMCKYAFRDTVNAVCNDSGNGPFSNSVGGFSTDEIYWSFSEDNFNGTLAQGFYNGNQYFGYKNGTLYVRPVRAF